MENSNRGRKNIPNEQNRLLYDPNERIRRNLGTFSMQQEIDEEDEIYEEIITEEDNEIVENEPQIEDENEVVQQPKRQSAVKLLAHNAVKEVANKSIKAFIMKNPIVLVILGIIILLFIVLLFFLGSGISDEQFNSSSYSDSCEEFPLHGTTLSLNEFVEKLETNLTNNSAGATAFKQNAESIYKIATSNNINPEVVVVRAMREGFSPGTGNNYWGMGCTNTGNGKDCIRYSSFDEGVLGFVKNVSQYDTLADMMSRYAYIGKYWYSQSGTSSGKGGCYYYPYIKQYLSPYRAAQVEKKCNSGKACTNGESWCLETTDEDQLAYSKWQVSTMADSRLSVFNLGLNDCSRYSSSCTIYAQGDSKWKNIPLGNSSSNMGNAGCAVTSIAIGISCSGTELTVDNFDAGVFIKKLNAGGCFTASGGIYWTCAAISEIAPNVSYLADYKNIKNQSNISKMNLITQYDPNETFILLHFQNQEHVAGHFVVYDKQQGDYVVTKDPAGGRLKRLQIREIDRITVYSH